ncbi:hypothetical protein Tco_1305050 [Tanacetum coccineum]
MSLKSKLDWLMELIVGQKKLFDCKKVLKSESEQTPPSRTRKKNVVTYMKHNGMIQGQDFSKKKAFKSFDAIKKMFDKAYKQSSKKRRRAVLGEESVKRQKVEDHDEKAKLKACLEIVSGDDSAIIKADGSTKYNKIFSAMLDDFDKQDVLDLYRLGKERFKTTSPEGYDRLLWGDLITLFEPIEEDEIWKTQQDYTLISWKLYDSCGVHLLLMDTGCSIHIISPASVLPLVLLLLVLSVP